MAKSQTNNNWWALVRFPNEDDIKRILLVSEITHKVITVGNEVEYRPKNLKDFVHVQPYRIRTANDAVDGLQHSYFCQIHTLSGNKQDLEDLIAPDAPKRLNWTRIPNFPKDPETSCDEASRRTGSGVLQPKQRELTGLKQLNRDNQNTHLDAALRHLSKSNSSDSSMNIPASNPTSNPTSNLEEKYVQEIQRLQEELRRQREELEEEKKRNMAADLSDNAISALKTELTEFLNQRMHAIAQENKNMVNQFIVQNTELKEEISGLRSGMFPRVWEWLDNISPGGF